MVASGTFGYGSEVESAVEGAPMEALGGIILKSVTLEPRLGNPGPRTVETYGGMLNTIGLQNIGVRSLVEKTLPALEGTDTCVVVNVAGSTVEEYVEIARILHDAPAYRMVELNISCPNVKEGGIEFGVDCPSAARVVAGMKAVLPADRPLVVKLTPNVTDIAAVAIACVGAGADAVSCINTLQGMAIDVRTRRPILGNNFGGLSGPAIKPVALHRLYRVAERFREEGITAPILGMGGIVTLSDALEFMIAGASAVAVGTATFYLPDAAQRIIEEMRAWLAEEIAQGRSGRIADLIGTLRLNTPEDFE
ncbi:MAG: dihydroorotate dehydrogenase [Armatimonadetes bacterium]|nr:dihydroorotate dehydrogenase [Armatimonadota bacterium]